MILIYIFILFAEVSNCAEIEINIQPDSIYVGSTSTITISILDLDINEFPVFKNIVSVPDTYSVIEVNHHSNSIEHKIQFWTSGKIKIPPIPVEIFKNKKNIYNILSDAIEIFVVSNIDYAKPELKQNKPMKNINLTQLYWEIFYTFIIILGISLLILLWKNKKNKSKLSKIGKYSKPIKDITIKKMNLLKVPNNINLESSERFYSDLSKIFRYYIKNEYFIRATEMTSTEIEKYFYKIGIKKEDVWKWSKLNRMIDLCKYGRIIPAKNKIIEHKEQYINLVKIFQRSTSLLDK